MWIVIRIWALWRICHPKLVEGLGFQLMLLTCKNVRSVRKPKKYQRAFLKAGDFLGCWDFYLFAAALQMQRSGRSIANAAERGIGHTALF